MDTDSFISTPDTVSSPVARLGRRASIVMPTLRQKAKGNAVRVLQQSLNVLGFNSGAVDGDFGPNTLRAVRRFQANHGLAVDGVVGVNTWTGLVNRLTRDRDSTQPPHSRGQYQQLIDAITGGTPATPTDPDFDIDGIVGLRNNAHVTQAFIAETKAIARRHGFSHYHLLGLMSFETGGSFSPSVQNPTSRATGLIQFIPSTARNLGTTVEALARMSSVAQLAFVEKYFAQPQYRGKLGTLEGLYSAVLSGTATPNPDDTLRNFVRGHRNYTQNSGLDFNDDGRITSGEATMAVAARLYGGVRNVQQLLVNAGVVPSGQRAGFVDGHIGKNTIAAIRRFQSHRGLAATGYLNDATGRALSGNVSQPPAPPPADLTNLRLSEPIDERVSRPRSNRQRITSTILGTLVITEAYMARGGPHSRKRQRRAIFSTNPTTAETVPAGVYNLGIDYFATSGRIVSWFDGVVERITHSSTGYGNRLIMRTNQTFRYQGADYPLRVHYAHADSFTVGENARIAAGQDIGDQGSTGHSTGDHVDFLIWIVLNDGAHLYISPNLLVTFA